MCKRLAGLVDVATRWAVLCSIFYFLPLLGTTALDGNSKLPPVGPNVNTISSAQCGQIKAPCESALCLSYAVLTCLLSAEEHAI